MEEVVPESSLRRQSHEAVEGAWPRVSQQQELARLLVVPTAHLISHLTCQMLLCSCGSELSLLPTMSPG